uniref:Aminotransferase-like plant mobile domain-containing protein n=1 Tax=Fagus sylvatica TaxID=28930 RepID=A0A2N9IES6_FAGSY
MASSSSHPPPDTAKASGDDSEVPTADAGTMDTGSVGDEGVDCSRFSPVPEDDRDDFAFPLLDPWYDNGGNFPNIPNKVSLPPSNWEWMLRGQEVTADRVWAPPLSSISDLRIQRGDMQPVPIDFEFPCSAAADWFHWVADEFMDVEFCALLERAGVAEAILLSRSCNMYRNTEALRQILRRWCASTHTFFFSWGELTITLEDVENHWLLPVLGDMDPFAVEMSEEETVVEQALMARASTRINAWSVYFAKATEPTIRRAAFVAYWLYSVCLDEIRGGSCHFITTCFNTSALQTFLWERSLNYQEVGNDNSQIREKFKNMSRQYFKKVPGFKDQSAASFIAGDIASQSFELSPDDTRSLTYLSAVNPGWLPVWSDEGVKYTHYCPNREYWLRVAAAMADYVRQGRGTRVPLPNHHAHPMETMTLSPPTQTAISYAERTGLRLRRMGWSTRWVDPTDSGKGASSPAASKQKPKSAAKASSKRPKVAMDMSMIPPSELGDRALMAPGTSKKKQSAAGASKSQKKSAVDPPVDPSEDTSLPSKETESSAIQEESAPPSTKAKSQPRSKSVAVKKAKSKPTRKSAVAPPSSSEEPAAESATPVEKESAIPTPPSTIYDRTRSKRKAVEEQVRSQAKRKVGDKGEGSDRVPIVIEEVSGGDDVVDAGAGATGVDESITERQEVALEPTDDVAAKDNEAVRSTTSIMAEEAPGETPVSMADVVPEAREVTPVMADETLVSMADETLVDVAHETAPVTADETLAGSAAEEDYDPGTDSVDSEETVADEPQPLQIIPFADQPNEPRVNDPIERAPLWWLLITLRQGPFTGGQVPALEGIPIQGADGGGTADTEVRGVGVVPEDVEAPVLVEKESVAPVASAAPSSSQTRSAVEGLSAKFGDFTTHFKFGAGFGGPMLSLPHSRWLSILTSCLSICGRIARKFFGEAIASEMKVVQEQISSLQSTLAVLVSYQGELMSAAAASPKTVEVASPIDGLFD